MAPVSFSVVDVFSTTAYKGNPLAVVDNTTAGLTTGQMQLIARQFNLSETTFFEQPTKADVSYRLRSFYPDGTEVFGSGHNILGAWWYLAQAGRLDYEKAGKPADGVFTFWQEIGTSVTPVNITKGVDETGQETFLVSVRQDPPISRGRHPDVDSLAASVGLKPSDLGIPGADGLLQPQMMSISTTRHLLVPVASVEALNRVSVERDRLAEQLARVKDKSYGIYFFTPEEGSNNYLARFFSTGMSSEDPATGSAAGPLSAYLYRHGGLDVHDGRGSIRVRQGLLTGRECVIDVGLTVVKDTLSVTITGSGARVMEGSLIAPVVEA